MDKYLVINTPNFYVGRRRKLRLVVWHSTESNEVQGGAYNIAKNWFGVARSKVSAHITVDDGTDSRYPSGVCESVMPWDTAWHCGNANADGYGVEIIGKAAQGSVNWRDEYSLAAIRNACRWLKWNPHTVNIPSRWLSDEQVRNGSAGHVTHEQVARVLGGSTHTDPGAGFPREYVMQQLAGQPPVVIGERTLSEGATGDDVWKLQSFVNLRFPTYKDTPIPRLNPPRFGPQTKRVIQEFQRRSKINADGIVGPQVYSELRKHGWK